MSDKSQKMSVDLEVLSNATTALQQSVRDMDGLTKSIMNGSLTIPPGAFTLWDPGALHTYAETRQYVINFLADMKSRFNQMTGELEEVIDRYSDNESGIRESFDAMSN